MSRSNPTRRSGFVTLLVLWVLVLAALVISAVQSTAFGEAVAGRESLARVRAYWAARAGVEATLARLEYDTLNPDTADGYAVIDDMVDVADGMLDGSLYRVSFTEGAKDVPGPADAHAKLNINAMSAAALMTLPYMTEDVADSILDWVDPDDDTNPLGAEIGYYQSLPYPYEPRNAPIRSMQELELVAGVLPEFVRGEDWNLNGLLDPNEDDADASFPSDNADGKLDAGWSALLTCDSVGDVLSATGEARLDLRTAAEGDVSRRTQTTADQARAIVDYVANTPNAMMRDFIRRDLRQLAGGQGAAAIENLSRDQLALLLDECGIDVPTGSEGTPGKVNLNTAPAELLQYIPSIDAATADSIIFERDSRPNGFTSIVDLLDVPGLSRRRLATIADVFTVRSNAFVVTCRGRDANSGLEVEIVATLDRSSVPVTVSEITVR